VDENFTVEITSVTPTGAEVTDDAAAEVLLGGRALRLLELHRPRDAGGITSDPSNPIRRCRSCMWRWPCPTFRAFSDALGGDA